MRLRFAFAFGISGCALLTNLDGLSQGDGGADVSSSDVTSDGAVDASSVDGATTTFCSTVDATFCEDFDEPDGDYLGRWSGILLNVNNTVATQTTEVTSAPRALVVEVPVGGTVGAGLKKDLPPSGTSYEATFDVRFEPYDAGPGSVAWAMTEVDTPSDAGSVFTEYRFVTAASTTLFEAHVYYPDGGNTIGQLPLTMTFQPGKFYHVDQTITLVPPPAKIQIIVDGTPIISTKLVEATNGTGYASFLAGIYHANPPTGAWRMEFDNVVLNVQ